MGDYRTYESVIAIIAITTDDFMMVDWTRMPYDILAKVSNRITNEVTGINRIVYDITRSLWQRWNGSKKIAAILKDCCYLCSDITFSGVII